MKRDNVQLFCDRVNSKKTFQHLTKDGNVLECTGKSSIDNIQYELTADSLVHFIKNKKLNDHLDIEVNNDGRIEYMRPTSFFKDSEFGGRPAKSSEQGSERQEIGMLKILNDPLYQNLVIDGIGCRIKGAQKKDGLNAYEKEPYADIVIKTMCDQEFGVSMKGGRAPSIAGGGLSGLKKIDPDLIDRVYSSVISYYKGMNYCDNDLIDAKLINDLFFEIPIESVRTILTGTAEMGGPVHFLYIGNMDVSPRKEDERLFFNGNFYSIEDYLNKTNKIYVRVRKREIDDSNKFVLKFSELNNEGYPVILKTYSSNKNSLRFVMTDTLPKNGIVL